MSTSTGTELDIRVGPRPGDFGTVLAMHGHLYAREYGYDERFEGYVAQALGNFADALGRARDTGGPRPGWLWVAERAGSPVGTVALTDEGGGTGQLRWFLVRPEARGSGLGRKLLAALLDHARSHGFKHVKLWTVEGLDAAAYLYQDAGFRRTEQVPGFRFGQNLTEARYDIELT